MKHFSLPKDGGLLIENIPDVLGNDFFENLSSQVTAP